jgi:hypothetical protein
MVKGERIPMMPIKEKAGYSCPNEKGLTVEEALGDR